MPELGSKYICFRCETKFYDLGRLEPICPRCGANQKEAKKHDLALAEAAALKKRRREEASFLDEELDESAEEALGFGDELDEEAEDLEDEVDEEMDSFDEEEE
jgi:uncharacterized protein (TIGR02300 family)